MTTSATNVYTGQCKNSFNQEYFIDTVSALSSVSLSPDHAFAQLLIGPNQNHVQFKTDTGSAVNILPHSQFKSLNVKHPLEAPSHKLTAYTGDMLLVIGMVKLACCHKDKVINALFYVVEGSAPPLVSLQSSVDIDLIKLTYAVETSPLRVSSDLDKQSVMNSCLLELGSFPGSVNCTLRKMLCVL